MSDLKQTLARIRKQVEAATEGPWNHYSINPRITPEHAVYSMPLDADPLARSSEIAGSVAPRDAEFIAASRTVIPTLLDALDAALDLHKPAPCTVTDGRGVSEATVCEHCLNPDWPCETVAVISAKMKEVSDALA